MASEGRTPMIFVGKSKQDGNQKHLYFGNFTCRECAIERPTRSAASSLSARRSDGHLRRSSSPALRTVSRCRLWSVQPSPHTRDTLHPSTTRRLLCAAVRSPFEPP